MEQAHQTSSHTYQVPCLNEKDLANTHIEVSVPGSKSITNRALLLATLAGGTSTLRGVLFSDDSRHFLKCIQDLGFETFVNEEEKIITVTGLDGNLPLDQASIYVGSAGTAARFLTAFLGVSNGTWHLDASPQMKKRPMAPLLDSLRTLGCEVTCHEKEGFFPFTLKGHGFESNQVCVNIDHSSQFLSALMISSRLATRDVTLKLEGTHGMSYIEITRQMMEQFGLKISTHSSDDTDKMDSFLVSSGGHYDALDYQIEPDVSAACYFYAMALLLGIRVTVKHVTFSSMQGDIEFLRILEKMGASLEETPSGICITGPSNKCFLGISVDMSACSDQAITLAAIAPFASTPTTITGIGHIRFQESDRISAIVTELSRMGIRAESTSDSVTIYPGTPTPCLVETYDDHRMAMGFSLIGLRAPGIIINDPDCCRKTFENYFDVLGNFIAQWK